MSKKRLYAVRPRDLPHAAESTRLVEASSEAQAIKHVADNVLQCELPRALEAARLVAMGCLIETAGVRAEPELRCAEVPPAVSDEVPAFARPVPPAMPAMVGWGVPEFVMSPEVAAREEAIRNSPEVLAAIAAKEASMSTMSQLAKPMSVQVEEAFAERNAIGEIVPRAAMG